MINNKNIVIIDDHPLFRAGLKSIAESHKSISVAGEAGNAKDGMEIIKKIKPELAIVDISLPDKNGINLSSELLQIFPDLKILIVSMHAKIDYIAEAFQAGAKGYITKDSASDRLIQGIETVLGGEYFLDSSVSHHVIEQLMKFPVKQAKITDSEYGKLTPREQEILRLLAEGENTKQIGDYLCISPKTVENHRTNIMNKLDIHSTMDLVKYAARLGLIDLDLWKE